MSLIVGLEKPAVQFYGCLRILNPIELAWNQLKYHVGDLNVYTSKPSKVVDKFGIMDHILIKDIELFIIDSSENDGVNDSWDEM